MATKRVWGFPNDAFQIGSSGGAEMVSITAAQAYDLAVAGSVRPGVLYKISGYRCVNWLNGFNVAFNNESPLIPLPGYNPRAIHVNAVEEEILIYGLTPHRFEVSGWSLTYNDQVWYNPVMNSWGMVNYLFDGADPLNTGDLISGFELKWGDGVAYIDMPTGFPVEFGHFMYLEWNASSIGSEYYTFYCDPVYPGENSNDQKPGLNAGDNAIYLDGATVSVDGMRVVLPGITQAVVQAYDAGSLYMELVVRDADAYGYIARRRNDGMCNDIPLDYYGIVQRRYEVDYAAGGYPVYGTVGYTSIGWRQGLPDFTYLYTTGDYLDVGIFGRTPSNVNIEGFGHTTGSYFYSGVMENVVFFGEVSWVNIKLNSWSNCTYGIDTSAWISIRDVSSPNWYATNTTVVSTQQRTEMEYVYSSNVFCNALLDLTGTINWQRCFFDIMNTIRFQMSPSVAWSVKDYIINTVLSTTYSKFVWGAMSGVIFLEYYSGSGTDNTRLTEPY